MVYSAIAERFVGVKLSQIGGFCRILQGLNELARRACHGEEESGQPRRDQGHLCTVDDGRERFRRSATGAGFPTGSARSFYGSRTLAYWRLSEILRNTRCRPGLSLPERFGGA